jgi:hypothetical protein
MTCHNPVRKPRTLSERPSMQFLEYAWIGHVAVRFTRPHPVFSRKLPLSPVVSPDTSRRDDSAQDTACRHLSWRLLSIRQPASHPDFPSIMRCLDPMDESDVGGSASTAPTRIQPHENATDNVQNSALSSHTILPALLCWQVSLMHPLSSIIRSVGR